MDLILVALGQIAYSAMAVPTAIYVFGVTLLGTAIERAQQEESNAKSNELKMVADEIAGLERNLKEVKVNGNTNEVANQIRHLQKNQNKNRKKIGKIKSKYSRIDVSNTVVLPSLAFIVSGLLGQLENLVDASKYFWLPYTLLLIQAALLIFGFIKIYLSLSLIQEIISTKKESESADRLKKAVKEGLAEYYQGLANRASIKFVDKKFPLSTAPSTELEMPFRVRLEQGSVLSDFAVWFFIPEGFELITPPEKESWRQTTDYDLGNIRTIKVTIPRLSIGPSFTKTIVLKTPPNHGTYSIRYKCYAEGFQGPSETIKILVE